MTACLVSFLDNSEKEHLSVTKTRNQINDNLCNDISSNIEIYFEAFTCWCSLKKKKQNPKTHDIELAIDI